MFFDGGPEFFPRGVRSSFFAKFASNLTGELVVFTKVFEATSEGVVGLVDVGWFSGDAVEFEDDEAFATPEAFFVGDANVVAPEVKAFIGEADFVEGLGEFGSDPVAGVFEDGSEAVGAEFGEGDFLSVGGDFSEAKSKLLEEVLGHRSRTGVFEEKLFDGVASVSKKALRKLAGYGGDDSGGPFGEASPVDTDFEAGNIFLHEGLAFTDSIHPVVSFFEVSNDGDAIAALANIGFEDEGPAVFLREVGDSLNSVFLGEALVVGDADT